MSERDHRIRRARESDLPAVRTAVARSWREGYEGVIDPERLAAATADPAEFYPADRFEAKLDDDDLAFLVAVPAGDDDPRGIATVNWGEGNTHGFVPAGESQFRSVYVDPDWWGGRPRDRAVRGRPRTPPRRRRGTVGRGPRRERARTRVLPASRLRGRRRPRDRPPRRVPPDADPPAGAVGQRSTGPKEETTPPKNGAA